VGSGVGEIEEMLKAKMKNEIEEKLRNIDRKIMKDGIEKMTKEKTARSENLIRNFWKK